MGMKICRLILVNLIIKLFNFFLNYMELSHFDISEKITVDKRMKRNV
jgi:hypothetical protein